MTQPEPRRCFDDRCRVRADCPLYARRNLHHGPGASTWRHGWEYPDGPCAVAYTEWEAGKAKGQVATEEDA